MSDTNASPLAGLLKLEEYQQQRAHMFPGLESLRWYMRNHRAGLQQAGALLYIAGRLWVDPTRFDAQVLDAGRQAAQRQREAA